MVLQSIRERLTGVLAFTILGILVIPFALVGVNSYFTSGNENIVARVNETEIAFNEFNQSYANYRRQMQSVLGAAYDPLEFDQLIKRREHLDNLIDQELLSQAAESMGLDVDDSTLAQEIRNIPAFQVEGQFNPDVYQSRLLSQGMSPKQFENEMRSQFVVSQLPRNITLSSLATASEVKSFIGLLDQTRTFDAVLIPAAILQEPVVFSEDEVSSWYESHSEDFQSEEQVVIEYIELDSALMPVATSPDEDTLREQFNAQQNRFISPEQRRVAHILIEVAADAAEAEKETARQIAQDLSKRARAGEDFATLARDNSQDMGSAASGGELGWVEAGVMVQAFEKAMYELSMEAPISEPVQTGFGWHVIKLQEIRESTGMSFEEARPTLVREYEEDVAARMFLEQADRLVDLIYEDPTTLESAAMVMELPVKEAGPFTRNGGQDGISANPDVVDAAFSDMVLLQGSVSDPITLDENHMVMVRLKEHLPVALKPLDEVRDEILATLNTNLARGNAEAKAMELLASLRDGEGDLEAIAIENGLEYARHESVRRRSTVPDATLVQEVFRLPSPAEGETVKSVLPTSSGFAVVELVSITPGEMDNSVPQIQQQYERVIANIIASQEAFALVHQLRASASIEIFEDKIR